MKSPALDPCIDTRVIADAEHHAAAFARRDPFRHVVIENFFAPDYAASLLAQFPAFERGNARNEAGEIGGKSTVEHIRGLGEPWAALDDLVRSQAFLDLVGRITGIEGLLYDPYYFGGGTHENREGQDLDPHVDFNRHPVEGWHRRLNLIVYLNHEWNDAWGGSLELHSDPRSPDDRVTRVTPLFNRAVIFETTEWSWHGFGRIALPADRHDLSRKSIALYFYTRERPAEELADTHSTIYVDRPLPGHFRAGTTLTEADVEELRVLLQRRDQHNQRLYRDITRLDRDLALTKAALYRGVLGQVRLIVTRFLAARRQNR
jgi:Rps23 Pro-64 3,4-dihydroxylase Tpa1-like proline 4-hydroxylase